MKHLILGMSMAAMLFMAACSSDKNQDKKTQEKFQVFTPLLTDTAYKREYVADIHAMQNVEIRSRINGYLEDIRVDEGQSVRKGQVLFVISGKAYLQDLQKARAALKMAEAELKSSEVELQNVRSLVGKNIVSATELEMARAKTDAMRARVDEARSNEAQAELNLSFTEVRAPFDGTINRLPNKTGSLINEGTLLTTLSDSREMFAYFSVSESEYLNYVLADEDGKIRKVSLVLANNTPYEEMGRVETVESEFDKFTSNISFRARFPNPDRILKHGASGKVLISNTLKNALIVPQKSTFEIQGNTYVFVVDKENKAHMRRIVPSVRLRHCYVISSGLSPQDRIVYEGVQHIRDGDKIIPEQVKAEAVLSGLVALK